MDEYEKAAETDAARIDDDKVKAAIDYIGDLISLDQPADMTLQEVRFSHLKAVRNEAILAGQLQKTLENLSSELRALKEDREGLLKEIANQNDRIQQFLIREATHAGMCAAWEKALIAVAQGFATGK